MRIDNSQRRILKPQDCNQFIQLNNTFINQNFIKVMFYFIRHAETGFNVVRANIKHKYGSSDYHTEPQWLSERFNLDNMDSEITPLGRKQSEQCRINMADQHIDLVLCSPLRRTMQTCDIVFRNHKSNPIIIVEPKLRQYFESTCDIGGRMRESMKEFDYFDFSLIEDPEVYYIHEIFDQEIKQRILNDLEGLQGEQRYQKGLQMSLEFLKEWHMKVVDDREVLKMMYGPMRRQRDYIVEKYKDQTKNIAIVSHSENLKAYLNKSFANCEILKIPQNEF